MLNRFRLWYFRFSVPINISINSSGKLINLEVQPTDSVKTIKHIIQMKENVPVDKQVTVSFNPSWATRLFSGFLLSALSLCLFVYVSVSLPSISYQT
jgi:hypothetical protein